jgi:hypothetical protein
MHRLNAKQVVYADGHHSINTSNHRNQAAFMASLLSLKTLHGPFVFDTVANVTGFNYRKANGSIAAHDLLNKINSGTYVFNKSSDSIYVVAHSMGFAYAQGMIETLRQAQCKVSRYYILAPENACSDKVEPSTFEEIWQYGTNEASDPHKDRDGVAPQCAVGNLDEKRAFIPETEKRDFLNSHYICNYHWIFKRTSQQKGYISERKK